MTSTVVFTAIGDGSCCKCAFDPFPESAEMPLVSWISTVQIPSMSWLLCKACHTRVSPSAKGRPNIVLLFLSCVNEIKSLSFHGDNLTFGCARPLLRHNIFRARL